MTTNDINRLLAERAMGWYWQDQLTLIETGKEVAGYFSKDGLICYEDNWSPLTNIAQAFQVVEAMIKKGYDFRLDYYADDTEGFGAEFKKPDYEDETVINLKNMGEKERAETLAKIKGTLKAKYRSANTPAAAISHAAAKALGYEAAT